MADTTASGLWSAARQAGVILGAHVDGGELRLRGRAVLFVSGGPAADFNLAMIDAGPEDEGLLVEFADRLDELGLPALFMLSAACAGRLGATARAKRLVEAGTAPLMSLTEQVAEPPAGAYTVERVTDLRQLGAVTDLTAAAFALDREWVSRTFCSPNFLHAPGISFFLASRNGEPHSSVCTTGQGTVGIWSMATPPELQRRGAGKAALLGAIAHHLRQGAEAFYLIATPAGKPLYDAVGFRTVEEFPIWVSGDTDQFAAQ